MKLLLTLFTILFAFNANALSFTERMSMQHKPAKPQEQTSSLTKEDMALKDESCTTKQDYSQLVQALLIIIAIMSTMIYFQNKKIQSLTKEEE